MRLRSLFRRGSVEKDLDDELSLHVDMLTRENIQNGMTEEEARRAALKEFGGMEYMKEECRESWGIRLWEGTSRNLRLAFRRLIKSPGFTLFCVVTLGLAIGVVTSIFSILDATLFRPLPVENPKELRALYWITQDRKGSTNIEGRYGSLGNGSQVGGVFPFLVFQEFKEELADLADCFGYLPRSNFSIETKEGSRSVASMLVSDNYFDAYGATVLLGRTFSLEGSSDRSSTETVITYRLWERIFGLDTNPIGRALNLEKSTCTVIGVLPPSYRSPVPGDPGDIYLLLSQHRDPAFLRRFLPRNMFAVEIMARLKPGVSDQALQTRAAEIFARNFEYEDNKAIFVNPDIIVEDGSRGPLAERRSESKPVWNLFGVAGVALLVACANLGSFMLLRGEGRRHELATYAALGARPLQLSIPILWESLILALLGAGVGLLIAVGSQQVLLDVLLVNSGVFNLDLGLDYRIAIIAFLIAGLTTLVFGLAPAIKASRLNAADDLKLGRSLRGATGGRLGKIFIVLQFSLAVPLAIGAALLAKSVNALSKVDPGYDIEKTLLVTANFDNTGLDGDQKQRLCFQIEDTLAGLPGVTAVSYSNRMPLGNRRARSGFNHPGVEGTVQAYIQYVTADYFANMNIPLEGRTFQASDTKDAQSVAIIDRRLAGILFPGERAMGRSFNFGNGIDHLIIGICGDTKYSSLRDEYSPTAFFNISNFNGQVRRPSFLIHTSRSPLTLAPETRRAIRSINPKIGIQNVTTQEALFEQSFSRERIFSILCGVMASIAVIQACIGLFGSIAKQVAQRKGEIGLRMALGASAKVVSNSILREALRLSLLGCLIGLPLVFFASRLIEDQLFQISPSDPLNIASVFLFFLLISLLAAWIPAARATRIHPSVALRAE